jgi:hypothetical protein
MRWTIQLVSAALTVATLILLPCRLATAVDNLSSTDAANPRDKPPATAELRKAIEQSLPYIEQYSDAWIHNRGCITCHVVSFSIWSNEAAKQKGFAVNQKKLDQWIVFTHGESPDQKPAVKLTKDNIAELKADGVSDAMLDKLKPIEDKRFEIEPMFADKLALLLSADELKRAKPSVMKRASREAAYMDPDTYGQLLLGGAIDRNVDQDWAKKLASSMLSKQKPNGIWPAGGQLPGLKRPKPESDEATTMWIVLALAANPEAREASADARKRALEALKKTQPGETNESLILHLMIARQFGNPGEVEPLLKQLRAAQHADGGWSWQSETSPSDAFATGQTLYALHRIGVAPGDPAIERAQEFLLKTQQKDGSWKVASQGPGTSVGWTFWGTTWAVIGLSNTLPD